MLDPTTLFAWEDDVDQRTVHAPTLVVTLGSYVDAGHTQRLLDRHLLENLPHRLLGRFDADQVLDYAGRRPTIVFDRDHFSRYDKPEIALHLVTDVDGHDFLLLHGPEPSLQWERMAASVRHVVEQLDVRRTVLVQTMPSPSPHTRPVAITRYASDPRMLGDDHRPLMGTFQLSASFTGVLTVRLGEHAHEVLGLVAHVPHYVADADYPAAALAMMDALRENASLALPAGGLDLAGAIVGAQLDRAVAENEELATLVAQLEEHYDKLLGGHQLHALGEQVPSADEIGHQFEQYLAGLGGADRSPDAPGPDTAGRAPEQHTDEGPDEPGPGDDTAA